MIWGHHGIRYYHVIIAFVNLQRLLGSEPQSTTRLET
jgi:hypothetical protein